MKPSTSSLLSAFQSLRLSPAAASPLRTSSLLLRTATPPLSVPRPSLANHARLFSATALRAGSWLEPNLPRKRKMMKGRPRVATGGSTKGTTVVWGDFGLRMVDHHRRISAKHWKMAEDTIKARLRGNKYRLYKRVACNVGVFVSGNEMRMGKGKGSFDHWAARVAVNQIAFEIRGQVHEQVIRDAFRLAGNKLPGQWEVVTKADPPVVGITKLENGLTIEDLKRPRKKLVLPEEVAVSNSEATTSAPPPS
ncbi:ribosomal protein L10e/L16 [Podospora australis]|uniref:Ribosomal protein L10e/L16 n=1 Tax=Podospora australis TaxID=1536484 RepID=A0AAN6WXF1_9PEZI|nr:ribosomal protein L10e/L16 [Podospora australis]